MTTTTSGVKRNWSDVSRFNAIYSFRLFACEAPFQYGHVDKNVTKKTHSLPAYSSVSFHCQLRVIAISSSKGRVSSFTWNQFEIPSLVSTRARSVCNHQLVFF
ncbi:hypothetical protein M7I_5684 [Glarea lozoyensis 74030]|uniref:Uncharacterized protein n=1 Tax=Glarea lozoyensis (strain ATCC 74030 / MF5533) TaxID=1104152 RepID=H0ESJ4_GLAL7|nr:hypothetical protein M7I_5684 [Glarea lozoyensis 74030]